MRLLLSFFFSGYGDDRDQHEPTHSYPTRRSSELREDGGKDGRRQGGEAGAARNRVRRVAGEQRQRIFLPRDRRLDRGHLLLGRMIFGLGLPQIELRGIARFGAVARDAKRLAKLGRASGWERGCRYGSVSVVGV